MKKILLCCLFLFVTAALYSQTGKYFIATGEKCKTAKVFIDHRIQEYCGTEFTVDWSGNCKEGFAEGNGTLTIVSKKNNRSFTMKYDGMLIKGKKEGKAELSLYLYELWIGPYYNYKGSFKNDEFHGYGEFGSDYPYPIDPDNIGKGISMENLGLDLSIWRSDLFFYIYKGNFIAGKIGDTENAIGRTKRMRWVGDLTEYKGPVKNGKPNGRGTATEVTVKALMQGQSWGSATGNFVNGRLEGYGKQITSWSEYNGEFVNSWWEGKGKLTFYEYDAMSKEGRSLSSELDANFKQGLAEGYCTISYNNSAAFRYTGPIRNGEIEGTGEIEYVDGSKFRGNFRSGKREGEGTIIFADGDKFNGEYKNDMPVKGTFYYSNGSKYEGEISVRKEKKNDKIVNMYIKQGKGTITYSDGTKREVTCENDNCN